MALPTPDDGQRRLRLAVRLARSMGVIFLLLGGCATIPLFMRPAPAAARLAILRDAGSLLFYIAPGAAYLVCSNFLLRRRFWALVTMMGIAGVQILLLTAGVVMMSFLLVPAIGGLAAIPLGIMSILLLGLAQLEYHLARSFRTIRQPLLDEQRGFEPLRVTPAMLEPSVTDDPPRGGPHVPPAQG